MKTTLLRLLKFALPVVIIGWLLASVDRVKFQELAQREKNWGLLLGGAGVALAGVSLTFVRWFLLVRALGLRFQLRDAFRLGFLGYLLNFVSAGSVGGDLFKAIFIAREQPGRRAEAVASVVVDRMVGLYALLLVTTVAILVTGVAMASTEMVLLTRVTFVATAAGAAGIGLLLIPGFTSGRVTGALARIPRVGDIAHRLILAIRIYRNRPGVLSVAVVMSCCTHLLLSLSVFLLAHALFPGAPGLNDHLIMVPMAMVFAALPFTPAGIGTFELAIEQLYLWIPAPATVVPGILVALAFRVVTIVIAMIGVVVYWTSRAEVQETLEEARHEGHEEEEERSKQRDVDGIHTAGQMAPEA